MVGADVTGGWRALPLAPVYALLITSALVSMGGAVLQSSTRVQFEDLPRLPHRPFPVALIRLRDNRLLDTAVVDTAGEARFATPAEDAQLCVIPPGAQTRCTLVQADTKDLRIPPFGVPR